MAGSDFPDFGNTFDDDYADEDDVSGEGGESLLGMERLPPPPEIGGSPGYSEIEGRSASVVPGRNVSAKLFTQAAGHPTVSQLRVFKLEHGNPVSIGVIGAEANEEDFVREFLPDMPQPGDRVTMFRLRPLDINGEETGFEAPLPIGENHAALRRLRAARARREAAKSRQAYAPPAAASLGGIPSDVLSLVTNTVQMTQASLAEERRRSAELLAQLGEERMGVASNATASVEAMSARMLEANTQQSARLMEQMNASHQQSSDNTAAFFSTQLQAQQALRDAQERAAQQRLEEERARRAADAEEARRRRDEERAEWERRMQERDREQQRQAEMERLRREEERERADRRWEQRMREDQMRRDREREEREAARRAEQLAREEREAVRQREHEAAMRRMEIEAQQQREHAERMAALQQQQAQAAVAQLAHQNGGGLEQTLEKITATLALVGLEPRDIMERLLSGGGGGDGGSSGAEAWAKLAGTALTTAGEFAKTKMIADAQRSRPQLPPPSPLLAQGGQMPLVDPRMVPPPQGAPGGYPIPPQGHPDWEDDGWDDDDDTGEFDPNDLPPPPPTLQQAQAARARQAAPSAAAPSAAPGPSAAVGSVPLRVARVARKALRELAVKVANAPAETREGLVMMALTSTPEIAHYCAARSVFGALMEASNNNEALTREVIEMLRKHPLMPDDVNYGDGGGQ